MISKSVIFGLLFVLAFAAGQLIEIDESQVKKDRHSENTVITEWSFGQSDFEQSDFGPENGGLEILGPMTGKGRGKDKPTVDPWKQFYDPDYKNSFGQSFPAPEDVPQVPKRPASHNNGGFEVGEPETQTEEHAGLNHRGFDNEPQYLQYSQNSRYYPKLTTEYYNADKDDHFPKFGGILGWGKHKTNNPHKWRHGGGTLGDIIGDWKEKHRQNKEAIDKAANSVKETGEKIVDAGKDILGAGWKIGGNLLNPFNLKA